MSQADQFDHARDLRKHEPRPSDLTGSQQTALAGLIVACEVLCEHGILHETVEFQLRKHIATACAAFGLPPRWDRQ